MFPYITCAFVGASLFVSAWAKLHNPKAFARIIRQFTLLPRGILKHSRMIPYAEFVIAGLLVISSVVIMRLGIFLALGFIGLASALILARGARGETYFQCGCGTDVNHFSSLKEMLARNLVYVILLVASLISLKGAPARPVSTLTAANYLSALGLVLAVNLIGAFRLLWRAIKEWNAGG